MNLIDYLKMAFNSQTVRLLQICPSGQVTPPLPSESESMVHVNSPRTAFLGEVLNYYCQKYAKKLRLPRATESNTTAAYHMDRLAREAMVVEHHFWLIQGR